MSQITGQSAKQSRQQFNDLLLRTTPEEAAQIILKGVQRNKRRILVGLDATAADVMMRSMPSLYQRMVVTSMRLAARFAPKRTGKTNLPLKSERAFPALRGEPGFFAASRHFFPTTHHRLMIFRHA